MNRAREQTKQCESKSDAALQKLSKLLTAEAELSDKLLKLFSKQLDKIKVTDRGLAVVYRE